MKQSLILWISAAIITFLAGYIQNRTSSTYPVSGTIGIDGQKVSYQFKKICSNKSDYLIMIRSDVENLKGIFSWRIGDKNKCWQIDTMKYSEKNLIENIPKQPALTKVEYTVKLIHNNREYFIPKKEINNIKFLGTVPLTIEIHFYLTLFIGIVLAFRSGLEYFKEKPRLRLYSIFSLIAFFSCAMIFAPVKRAYEMGIIGKTVPTLGELFDGWLIALFLLGILNLILISYSKYPRIWIMIASILTLIIFLSQNLFVQ